MAKGKKRFIAIFLILLLAAIPVLAETQISFLSEAGHYSNPEGRETGFEEVEVLETEETSSMEEAEEPFETEDQPNVDEAEEPFETEEPPGEEESEETDESYLLPTELGISAELSDLSASVWSGAVAEEFGGGTGSRDDPYILSCASHLALMAQNVNNGTNNYNTRFFVLVSDINMNSVPWTPIGALSNGVQRVFMGTVDGGNHTISNLNVNVPHDNVGLFGRTASERVSISNLNVVDANVSGNNYVGIIVGQGSLDNSTASGHVSGNNSVGGLAGSAHIITDCTNHATVNGSENIGGLVGTLNHPRRGVIANSYNYGNISGVQRIGGIVGHISANALSNSFHVEECENHGDISASGDMAGGIVGGVTTRSGSRIVASRNYGSITGMQYTGGIAGSIRNLGFVYDSWNEGDVSGTAYVGGVTGWSDVNNSTNMGSVTATGNCVGGITGRGTVSESISVASISVPNGNYIGGITGFGDVSGSVHYGSVVGNNTIGGISGRGNVYNSSFSGYVSGNQYVGGIVGVAQRDGVNKSFNRGTIQGVNNIGGIAGGTVAGTTIQNVFNRGDVSGEQGVGGIVGTLTTGTVGASITRAYNTGTVTGNNALSGSIVGRANSIIRSGFSQLYFLAGSHPQAIGSGNNIATEDTSAVLQRRYVNLGDEFGPDTSNKNDGYPVLFLHISEEMYQRVSLLRNQLPYAIIQAILDPVDVITGNLIWEYIDFEVHGARNLTFMRTYNSVNKMDGISGVGWTNSFSFLLTETPTGMSVMSDDGFIFEFTRDGNTYSAPAGTDVSLVRRANSYIFTLFDKSTYTFNSDKQLTSIEFINGDVIQLEYTDGLMTRASNAAGYMSFSYSDGRIATITDNNLRSVSYEYDGDGNLVQFTNADGNSLIFVYDDNHNLVEIADFNGLTYLRNRFDDYNRVIEQYLADQGTFYFAYDTENSRTTFTDADGNEHIYYFDESGRITRLIDPDGETSQIFADGRLISRTDYMGHTMTFEYDHAGNVTKKTYPDGTTELFEYNEKRLVTRHTARDGAVTLNEFDRNGNLTRTTDPNGSVREFTFDSDNNMLTSRDATGAVTSFTYDSRGNRTSMTDAMGNVWTYAYDSHGRLIEETTPNGETTTYEYTIAGKLVSITDAVGNSTRFNVNANGFITRVYDEDGHYTSTAYDGMNNPISFVDREGNTTTTEFDSNGNVKSVTDALGNQTSYTFDRKGRMLSMTDARGSTWVYRYNANGELTEILGPERNNIQIERDSMGLPLRTTNARGAATVFTYDNAGRVTSVTDALGNTSTNIFDPNGNLIRETDWNGNETRFEFDAENRLIRRIDALGGVSTYEYDALGRLVRTTSAQGSQYETDFDSNGNVIRVTNPLDNPVEFVYDALGRVIERRNADGSSITNEYSNTGLLLRTTDENGNTTEYTYNRNGQVLTIRDPMGGVTTFTYDALGRIVSVTDAIGGVTNYSYDANGNILSVTDPTGGVTTYTYDRLNRVRTLTDANGGVYTFTYDHNGNLTRAVDAMGHEIRYFFDTLDRLVVFSDPDGNTFRTEYDANGNIILRTDARGNSISYSFDALNRITQINDQIGGITRIEYDRDGRITKVTNPRGAETVYEYDNAGRVILIKDAIGNETNIEYDAMDRPIRITDARGAITSFTYTPTGRIESITDPTGGVTRYTYNAIGRILTQTNPNNETTSFSYDALGRVVSVTDPLGNTEYFTYNANGQIASVTDKNGNITLYEYDSNGNLIRTTDALGNSSNFTYDEMNRLIKVQLYQSNEQGEAGRTQQTVYEYNGRGLVTRVINADNTSRVYVYDQNGNLIEAIDEDGYVREYTYDPRGLVESISYSGGRNVRFAYNATGDLIRMTDWLGTTNFSLDLLGRITAVNDHNGNLVRYEYDAVGNRSSIQYPDKSIVRYQYDLASRLISVTDAYENVTSYSYDAAGRLMSLTRPDGSIENYEVDSLGRVIRVTDGLNSQIRAYSFDAQGNLTEEVSRPGMGRPERVNYSYDALNRLTSVIEHGGIERHYTYDSLGNIIRQVNGDIVTEHRHNIRNQLVEKIVNSTESGVVVNSISNVFDNRGNLISQTGTAGTQTYEFDATNRMVLGTNMAGVTSDYSYNGLGYLAHNNGTDYVIDFTSAYQDILAKYVGDDPVMLNVFGLGRVSTNGAFIHNDRLGSGRLATDGQGNVVGTMQLDEWGTILDKTDPHGVLIFYTSYLFDDVLGVYFANARFYDPAAFRWLSSDPHWNPNNRLYYPESLLPDIYAIRQSANLYVYVMNNPLNYVDPTGLFSERWNQFWSDARDVGAGVVTGVNDAVISQTHGALAIGAVLTSPFSNDGMMETGNSTITVISTIINESTWAEDGGELIKHFLGVQNEALFYNTRIGVNYAGMAVSVVQLYCGLVKFVSGCLGTVGSFTVTASGVVVAAPALAGSLVVTATGALVSAQGLGSGYAMANIIGDNHRRLDEYLRRFDPCGEGPGNGGTPGLGSASPESLRRWNKGTFDSVEASLDYHFRTHGADVGASSVDQYVRKAEGFAQNLRGATRSYPQIGTPGAVRYTKLGKYIILAPDRTIISFGLAR